MKKSYLIGLITSLLILVFALTGVDDAQAAFGTGGATCTAQSKTAGTTLACTVATENLDAGNIAVLWFAGNNTATVDGNDALLSSVTDSSGNIWTVQRCFTNAQGGDAAGATTCIAWSKLTTTLTSGSGTITATFASIVAKAIVVKEFTVGAGNTIALVGTPQDLANDNSDPGSMTISGLTNTEHLFVRSTALERASGGTWTVTASHTTSGCNGTTGSGGASNMETCGEFRILTATTATSNPAGTNVDNASIFIAFNEVPPVGAPNKLAFFVQPSNTIFNNIITPSVEVEIQDASGNRVTTATNTVTIAIGTNPAGGTLSGTLSVSAVAGVATFSNLSINNAGNGYTLTASATGLTGATSDAFNITTGAYGLTECAGSRFGSNLGCTANDVQITNISVVGGLASCEGGSTITVDLAITVNSGSPNRYDVGIFISNDGTDPQLTSAASCSVGILPTTDPPFRNLDPGPWSGTEDTCGDVNGTMNPTGIGGVPQGSGVYTMTNVNILCRSLTGSGGNLYIPFVVSWDQQSSPSGATCTSIANPVPGTVSKCNAPTVTQGTVGVVVLPTITKTDNKTTLSPEESTTYTVVITNTTGVTLTNAVFTDTANPVGSLTYGTPTCATTGGAICPSPLNLAGMTIPSMPNNSTVTFTIPATVSPTPPATFTNTASVTVADPAATPVADRTVSASDTNGGSGSGSGGSRVKIIKWREVFQ